jgi:tRNA nucleotidyltransferase/poly(A) polymerase
MSDYLFMLESHLDAGQNMALTAIERLAAAADMNLWLTGGAMRDMLRGVPSRDLDFTVERDALKIGRALAEQLSAAAVNEDPQKRWAEIRLAGGLTFSVANARTEKYLKPGGKPQIAPATIHEDLSRRDFTINAIALSLGRRSRGLLIDPTNGQADLAARELRTTHSYAFFDDPTRIFRLIRFRHALGFDVVPRTQSQLENALSENYQSHATPDALAREIRAVSTEPSAAAALQVFDSLGLLKLLSPALAGRRFNAEGLNRLQQMKDLVIPYSSTAGWPAFLFVLTEKLNAAEKLRVVRSFEMTDEEKAAWENLEAAATELETALRSPRIHRPSHVWQTLRTASPDEILLVLYTSDVRLVHDRIRAYYEKYLPLSREVTEEEVAATGVKPDTPKFRKAHDALIAARLNARPPKPSAEPEPESPNRNYASPA